MFHANPIRLGLCLTLDGSSRLHIPILLDSEAADPTKDADLHEEDEDQEGEEEEGEESDGEDKEEELAASQLLEQQPREIRKLGKRTSERRQTSKQRPRNLFTFHLNLLIPSSILIVCGRQFARRLCTLCPKGRNASVWAKLPPRAQPGR